MSTISHRGLIRAVLLCAFSYGLLYYAIKAYDPRIMGGIDFFRYVPAYAHPLDLTAAKSPFVLRQISAVLTYLVHSLHIPYAPLSAAGGLGPDRAFLISAIIVNYAGLVVAAFVSGSAVEHLLGRRCLVPPLMAGFACLLAFHIFPSVLTGLTEGVSWMLFALALLFYLKGRLWPVLLVLALCVFQRETIPVIFGVFAAVRIALVPPERRFNAVVLAGALASFLTYLVIRKLGTIGFEEQFAPSVALGLRRIKNGYDFLLQGFGSNNLLFVYLATFFLAGRTLRFDRQWAVMLVLAWALLVVMGFLAGISNNVGRVSAILSPAFAVFIVLHLCRMDGQGEEASPEVR